MPAPRPARLLARFPATAVLAALLAVVFALEAGRARRSRPAVGVVRSVTPGGRSGITFAEVELDGPDGPRVAEVRSWYTRLAVGQLVGVRVRPGGRDAALDRAWDLHLYSIAGAVAVGVAGPLEATADRPMRRRPAFAPESAP